MSKSETIRQYLEANPLASNSEVINALDADKIQVTANLVNQVRHDYKHKKVKDSASVEDDEPLLRVKKLADEVGGVRAIDEIDSLTSKTVRK